VVIQRSSSAQTARLVDDLIGTDPVRREAAMARLAIVGERAVERLLAVLSDSLPPDATVVVLRVLESIGSPRGLTAALPRLDSATDAIAVAAVGVVRPHLRSADDRVAAQSLAALTTVALASRRSDPPRLAALEALSEMDADTVAPIRERLKNDASARVKRAAGWDDAPPAEPEPAVARLEAAARGALPEDGEALRALLAEAGGTVPLSVLHDLVSALRERERAAMETAATEAVASAETDAPGQAIGSGQAIASGQTITSGRRIASGRSSSAEAESTEVAALDWMTARAAVHQVLADRQSRLAVFDLRDTFEHASARLPVGFLDAIARIGDQSCLAALATAWQQVDDRWMRDHLAAAFQEIVKREGLSRRHTAVKRALERAPEATNALVGATKRSSTK
jgi:hypothetical protein